MEQHGFLSKAKYSVNEILNSPPDKKGFIYIIDDYFISGLIIANVIAIILESFDALYTNFNTFFRIFEIFSVIVFSIEYILRIWVADRLHPGLSKTKARMRYIFSAMGLIDLLAIVPFYLPFLVTIDLRFVRILRLLRLFRIFKLAHYSSSLRLLGKVISAKKQELLVTVFATFIVILITASLMYEIEHQVQPDQFPNIFATFWWAVATLTTIGYGDVYPVTGWGQFLAAVTALFGIGLVAIPTGILSSGFVEEISKRQEKKHKKIEKKAAASKPGVHYCPNCGEDLNKYHKH